MNGDFYYFYLNWWGDVEKLTGLLEKYTVLWFGRLKKLSVEWVFGVWHLLSILSLLIYVIWSIEEGLEKSKIE